MRTMVFLAACMIAGLSGTQIGSLPVARGDAIAAASWQASYYVEPYFTPYPPSQSGSSASPGVFSYDYLVTYGTVPPVTGQFITSVSLTGGVQGMVDAQGHGKTVSYCKNGGKITYALRVMKRDPEAPDTPVPISIRASADVSVSVEPYTSATAAATVKYRHPAATSYETLISVAANNSYKHDSASFDGLRAQPPDQTGFLELYAWGQGWGNWNQNPQGVFEWQAIADPLVWIDPEFTVMVGDEARPATDVYWLEMSEGFFPVPEPSTLALLALSGLAIMLRRRPV